MIKYTKKYYKKLGGRRLLAILALLFLCVSWTILINTDLFKENFSFDTKPQKAFGQQLSEEPSSFTIYWKYKADSSAANAPKTTRIRYGYIEDNTWKELPSPHKNNISKQLNDPSMLNRSSWFIPYGVTSSYFDVYQYNQQIEYNGDTYSFADCSLGTWDTSSSDYFQFTKMAWCCSNAEGVAPWKMYYADELNITSDTYVHNGNIEGYNLNWKSNSNNFTVKDHDVYMVYAKNKKNNNGEIASNNYFDVQMGNKNDPYAMDHCYVNCDAVDNNGNHLFYLPNNCLGKPVVYQPNTDRPSSSIIDTRTIHYLNLYEYFGRYIKYNGKYYTFDAADLFDNNGHNASNIVGVCLTTWDSSRASNRWCYCKKPTGSSATDTFHWSRPETGFDPNNPTYCTAHFKEVDISQNVDNIALGININLHDYDGSVDISDTNRSMDNGSINVCGPLDFSKGAGWGSTEADRYGRVRWGFNVYEQYLENAVHTGIFTNKLNTDLDSSAKKNDVSKHYPMLSASINSLNNPYNSRTDKSLNYLFLDNVSTDSADGGYGYKRNFSNLNHLFKKTSDGFYEYDSNKNFAQISGIEDSASSSNDAEETVNEVVLYDQPNKMHQVSSSNNFMPLNVLNTTSSLSQNYLFSMDTNMNFIQAPDGKIEGTDMQLSFNGDDDVAIFIDDVLVLDLMGVHQPLKGSINFATGEVTRPYNMDDIDNKLGGDYALYKRHTEATSTESGKGDGHLADWWKDYYVTTLNLYDIYEAAGATESTTWTTNTSGQKIFKNYSSHTFKMIYFERGMGDSDCFIRFNLPSIPTNPLEIGKQTTDSPNVIIDGSSGSASGSEAIKKKYKYYVESKDPEHPEEGYYPYSGTYKVYQGLVGEEHPEDKWVADFTTTNGVIEIQEDQVALIPDFFNSYEYATYEFLDGIDTTDDDSKWDVNVYYDGGDKSSQMTRYNLATRSGGAVSGIGFGGQTDIVDCKESIQFSNNLYLYDYILRNDSDGQRTIKLSFGNEAKTYYGDYYLPGDTDISHHTTTNGIITLEAGQTLTIKNVEQNTPFKVENGDITGSTKGYIFDSTNPPEDFSDTRINNPLLTSTYTSGEIFDKKYDPTVASPENFSRFNFNLVEPSIDLSLMKVIDGAYSDMTKQFDLYVSAKDSSGNTYATDVEYNGEITYSDGSSESKTVVYHNNEIMIKTIDDEGKPEYKPISLGHNDQIEISGILPYEGSIVVSEAYDRFYTVTGNINDGATDFNMDYDDESRFVSEDQSIGKAKASVVIKNNFNDIIHTLLNIFKYWLFIAMIGVLALLLYIFIKWRKNNFPKD